MSVDPAQHVFEIFQYVDVHAATGLYQTHQDSGSLSAFFTAEKQPVLAADRNRTQSAFAFAVVGMQPWISQKSFQGGAAIMHITDRVRESGFKHDFAICQSLACQTQQFINNRFCFFPANLQNDRALGFTVKITYDPFVTVNITDFAQYLQPQFRGSVQRVIKLAPVMSFFSLQT